MSGLVVELVSLAFSALVFGVISFFLSMFMLELKKVGGVVLSILMGVGWFIVMGGQKLSEPWLVVGFENIGAGGMSRAFSFLVGVLLSGAVWFMILKVSSLTPIGSKIMNKLWSAST